MMMRIIICLLTNFNQKDLPSFNASNEPAILEGEALFFFFNFIPGVYLNNSSNKGKKLPISYENSI